jgi:ubiquitin thioesterase protein OTUB1
MSRPTVLTGYHGHGQMHAGPPQQQQQQYAGVGGASHYEAMVHSGLSFARPLPMRAPVLVPAGFNHHPQHPQHTGHQQHQHHQHPHQHGRSSAQDDSHHHNHNHNHGQQLHHHGHSHAHTHSIAMADPYLASDEEMARLQKLSSEWEPEATVSFALMFAAAATQHQQQQHGRG